MNLTLWILAAMIVAQASPEKPKLQFVAHTIAADLKGGYQVVAEDLNRDGKPDLVALASDMPELVWFENPHWTRHVTATPFPRMINLAVVFSGPRPAIVLAGGFSNEARKSPGTIWVLEAGEDPRRPWTAREIDRVPTAHRLRLADIAGDGKPVIVNAPLTGPDASGPDYRGHTPLLYYRPGEWQRRLIGDENEGVVHGIHVIDWDGDGRDEILTASFVGIHLYKLLGDGRWSRMEITRGDPAPWPKCGASDVAAGRVGSRRFLCAIEPWHGHQIAVYREEKGVWERSVIEDSFVDGHTIQAADLNGDGRDEIIGGYRGAGGGLFVYTAEDDRGARWSRQTIEKGTIAAASCAVADFNGDGRPDIACIGSASANLKLYENRTEPWPRE